MINKNLSKKIIENIEKVNFYEDRLHENLYLIEMKFKKNIIKMKMCSYEESLIFFNEIEELNKIVSKVFYNRYKIEISDFLFHFMTDFERIDVEGERKRLWRLISSDEYKF